MAQKRTYAALTGRRVVVSGAGVSAMAALTDLIRAGARITVYADEVAQEISALASEGRLKLVQRGIVIGDAIGADLTLGANDDDLFDAHAEWVALHDSTEFQLATDLSFCGAALYAARPTFDLTQELA